MFIKYHKTHKPTLLTKIPQNTMHPIYVCVCKYIYLRQYFSLHTHKKNLINHMHMQQRARIDNPLHTTQKLQTNIMGSFAQIRGNTQVL